MEHDFPEHDCAFAMKSLQPGRVRNIVQGLGEDSVGLAQCVGASRSNSQYHSETQCRGFSERACWTPSLSETLCWLVIFVAVLDAFS